MQKAPFTFAEKSQNKSLSNSICINDPKFAAKARAVTRSDCIHNHNVRALYARFQSRLRSLYYLCLYHPYICDPLWVFSHKISKLHQRYHAKGHNVAQTLPYSTFLCGVISGVQAVTQALRWENERYIIIAIRFYTPSAQYTRVVNPPSLQQRFSRQKRRISFAPMRGSQKVILSYCIQSLFCPRDSYLAISYLPTC